MRHGSPRPEPDPAIVARLRAAGCVFAEDEALLLSSEAATDARLEEWIARRVEGEPLEQILGWAGFRGLRLAVEPGVFVPRLRTEFLVSQAEVLTRPGTVVVDLCCGNGAIGLALLAAQPSLRLYSTDLDPAAVRVAARNVGSAGTVLQGDLFAPLPAELRGTVGVIVANAPYVPTEAIAEMPPEARLHEHRVALDGGSDGLELHRRIAAEAALWLASGGSVLIETSQGQADRTAGLLSAAGLETRIAHSDEVDGTVAIGTLAP
jgi:release factor glutamine methyltransferase